MKDKQLVLECIEEQSEENMLEDSDNESDCVDNLIYKNRLKDLINQIAQYESLDGIQITKEAYKRLQENSKYIISILIFEIIEELKISERKQIKSEHVDKSLDRILGKVTAIDKTIIMLQKDIEDLESIRDNSISNKVNEFINKV